MRAQQLPWLSCYPDHVTLYRPEWRIHWVLVDLPSIRWVCKWQRSRFRRLVHSARWRSMSRCARTNWIGRSCWGRVSRGRGGRSRFGGCGGPRLSGGSCDSGTRSCWWCRLLCWELFWRTRTWSGRVLGLVGWVGVVGSGRAALPSCSSWLLLVAQLVLTR